MERLLQGDESLPARRQRGEQHRRFVGLGATRAEEGPPQVSRGNRRDALRERIHRLGQVDGRGVLQALRLFDDGRDDLRVTVTRAHHSYPAVTIQVAFPVAVDQPHALALHQHRRLFVEMVNARDQVLPFQCKYFRRGQRVFVSTHRKSLITSAVGAESVTRWA